MIRQSKLIIFLAVNFISYLLNCDDNKLFSKDIHSLNEEVISSIPAILEKGSFRDLKISTTVPDYDVYVLAVGWGNSLCLQRSCKKNKIKTLSKNIFTIHGFWPTLKSGETLPFCNKGKPISIDIQDKNLKTNMENYWISFFDEDDKFWHYEYNKHGYCYTNKLIIEGYEEYFRLTIKLFTDLKLDALIDDLISSSKEDKISITADNLINFINQKNPNLKFLLHCCNISGVTYLREIRFYISLDFELLTPYRKSNCPDSKPLIIPKHISPSSLWNIILIFVIIMSLLLSAAFFYYRAKKNRDTLKNLIEANSYRNYN